MLVTQAYLPLVDTALSAGRGRNKMSAATAARHIVAGMKAEIRDHHIGQARWLWRVFRISPSPARRIMRYNERSHQARQPGGNGSPIT